MSDLGRVVVLAGGLSHEREVSLRSGRRVTEALRSVGVDVELRDVDATLVPALTQDLPAVVFPALHGVAGEDGAVRDVLGLLGVPYVGATPAACRVAFDKPAAKAAVSAAGLATPDSVALPHATFRDLGASSVLDAIVGRLGLPLFVKPARGGSALGASAVRTQADLPHAMVGCFAYGDTALVERLVGGVEVAVSVVDTGSGPRSLPPVEIVPDGGVYDYAARYTAGMTEFFTPARLAPEAAERAAHAAVTAHEVLGLRDVSRTDLIVDPEGTPWFLEVNVAPGMTETSLLPQAAAAADLDLGALYRDLLHVAASRASSESRVNRA
ncbi:MAG: D-alanine--D-alanine ligase family protein [Carbonactinosporaceae bacterium]